MDLVLLLTKIEEAQYLESRQVGYTTSWEKNGLWLGDGDQPLFSTHYLQKKLTNYVIPELESNWVTKNVKHDFIKRFVGNQFSTKLGCQKNMFRQLLGICRPTQTNEVFNMNPRFLHYMHQVCFKIGFVYRQNSIQNGKAQAVLRLIVN